MIEQDKEGDMNYMLIHVGNTMDPDGVKVAKSPDEWVHPPPKTEKGGATVDQVENPGRWSSFSYCPIFVSGAQGGQYKAHCIPDGYHPVTPNEDNTEKCRHGGCNFPYQGWNKGGD